MIRFTIASDARLPTMNKIRGHAHVDDFLGGALARPPQKYRNMTHVATAGGPSRRSHRARTGNSTPAQQGKEA